MTSEENGLRQHQYLVTIKLSSAMQTKANLAHSRIEV